MDVQASSGINVNLTNNQKEKVKPVKKEIEQKKNGNKKLALALGGLAAIGAATVGIAYGIKTGKIKGLNKIAKQAENIADDAAKAAKDVADDAAKAAKDVADDAAKAAKDVADDVTQKT